MSLFTTKIPVPVQTVIDSLPKGHFLHGVSFDKINREIIVLWEYDRYQTKRTVPTDFPAADLSAGTLPKDVRDRAVPEPEKPAPAAPAPEPEAKKAPPIHILTAEEVVELRKKGVSLLFQGISSDWQLVDRAHTYVPGYYYCKASEKRTFDKLAVK